MPYLNECDAKSGTIVEIRRTQSGKGYLIDCVDFVTFMWNNDPLLKPLLIALSAWSDAQQGYVLEVVKDTKEKRGFTMQKLKIKGKEVPIAWRISPDGFTTKELNPEEMSNPFF